MPRLFVGLELPESLKQAIAGLQCGLRDARWLDEDGLHLTLAFIGDVDGSARRRIEEALSRVEAPSLEVELHGLGHFPLRGSPRVLWTGASPAAELRFLAAAVRRELSRAGYPPERRKFAPHVTIARFRRPPPPPALQDYLGAYALLPHPGRPGRIVPALLERASPYRRPVRGRGRIPAGLLKWSGSPQLSRTRQSGGPRRRPAARANRITIGPVGEQWGQPRESGTEPANRKDST